MRIKLVVEYDGTDFFGFQRQPGKRTVDRVLEEAISQVTGEEVRVTGSGRTDAGVHALGQVVAFDTQAAIPPDRYGPAINTFLPSDIRIVSSEEAAPDFHPRYQARWKTYRYLVYRTTAGYTLYRRHAYQYTGRLDLNLIKEGIRYTAGTHDFRGFMAAGSAVQDTVRTVCEFTAEEKTPWLKFEITGDGFLYKMVRNLVGTLLEIGRGAMSFEQLEEVMRTGNRTLAGPTAPARGLYLVNVDY
ncbi:MAG: tRNA pseudouridine(38-40) synthase TruA [Syntrophomonadaceae bacterium]|jgi:tRNA pseudouridine38-40 synthase|nr:tRNA pseudouridine(38-40) synthase TruA [Syntrophomonadaceae bacterium]